MSIELKNPPGLPSVDTHHQVSIATGSRLVFLAGQVAWNAEGATIGENDLATQVEHCYGNVATALAGAGASFEDVAKLTIYVVDWSADKAPALLGAIDRAITNLGVETSPPITLLGVSALAAPDLVVEIEATAVID